MEHLFENLHAPLPAKMRPSRWDEFFGQTRLVERLRGKNIHSMILYGPPGCGKTTLAELLAGQSQIPYHSLSAVSSGIKEVRDVIALGRQASHNGGVLLFIDEIHRFSKSQQDALLQAVESGWITLIGATTENPSFEIISPLLSRCEVYRLHALGETELRSILARGMKAFEDYDFDEDASELYLESAGGDARKMLRLLENTVMTLPESANHKISRSYLMGSLENALRNYDKSGENHYDFISAFIKSMRGSDPDAAVLYMAAMLEAGEDPLFIARRMLIFASEDIGNASPQALGVALSAFQAVERIGMPEGRIILSQAAVFLASSPKSNASYLAVDGAISAIRGKKITIPDHLRNAPTETHKKEGAGRGYKYPHDFSGHYVDQKYLPDEFRESQFYFPSESGQETKIKERLKSLRPERKYE